MNEDTGKNESRTLATGEVIHLAKAPSAKWKIILYEHSHKVRMAGSSGLVFGYCEGLPCAWKNQEFESADAAEAFVQEQVEQKKNPRLRE